MSELTVYARAKLNLCLEVLGRRADGYHDLRSVMQTVDLCDELTIKVVKKPNYLKLVCDSAILPTDERNLAYAAAKYMLEEYGIKDGVFIGLKKRIPIAAGLGGGSADCAAVIKGLNCLFNLTLTDDKMSEIGGKFGADVPFCVFGGTMEAEGIGNLLTPITTQLQFYVVIVKPPVFVSTAKVFAKYRWDGFTNVDTDGVVEAVRAGDLDRLCACMGNHLESVTCAEYPIIGEIKRTLLENGAQGALMSGSGPSAFGVFRGKAEAANAAVAVRRRFPEVREVYVARGC